MVYLFITICHFVILKLLLCFVMLNLIQHLICKCSEIPNRVRDDGVCVGMTRLCWYDGVCVEMRGVCLFINIRFRGFWFLVFLRSLRLKRLLLCRQINSCHLRLCRVNLLGLNCLMRLKLCLRGLEMFLLR